MSSRRITTSWLTSGASPAGVSCSPPTAACLGGEPAGDSKGDLDGGVPRAALTRSGMGVT